MGNHIYITTPDQLREVAAKYLDVEKFGTFGIDIETASDEPEGAFDPLKGWISTIQIRPSGADTTLLIDVQEMANNAAAKWNPFTEKFPGNSLLAPVVDLINDERVLKIAHNAKFEIKWFIHHLGANPKSFYDTMLASQIIAAGNVSAGHSLEDVAYTFAGIELDKTEQKSDWGVRPLSSSQIEYALRDAEVVLDIYPEQVERLKADDLLRTAVIDFDAIKPLAKIELNGMHLDAEMWRALLTKQTRKLDKITAELQEMLAAGVDWMERNPAKVGTRPVKPKKPVNPLRSKEGKARQWDEYSKSSAMASYEMAMKRYEFEVAKWTKEFEYWSGLADEIPATLNPRSVPQMQRVLKNVTGVSFASTNNRFLLPYAKRHPVVAKLIEHRGFAKLVSSYGENILAGLDANSRIHTNFRQILDTGRTSSSDPNLQQVPGDKEYRGAFTAPKGRKLIIADYSQIQLRILAEFSRDPQFVADFQSEIDLHTHGASRFFRLPVEQVDKETRNKAKKTNFGVIFAIGDEKLGDQIGSTAKQAGQLKSAYFKTYPGNGTTLAVANHNARHHLFARTMSGRMQRFNHDGSRGQIAAIGRNGQNMPIQGCVIFDNRITTKEFGSREIGSLVGNEVSVWDGHKYVQAYVAESGLKQLTWVNLSGRKRIGVSPEHKFLTISADGKSEIWKEAAALRRGDRIRFGETPEWSANYTFPECVSGKSNNANRKCLNNYEGDLFDLGIWLGRIASDGYIHESKVRLIVAEHEKEILPFLERVTEQINGRYRTSAIMQEHYNFPVYHIDFANKGLAEQLRELKSKIPEYVYADSRLLRGYLRGYFDGDGTVSVDGASITFGGDLAAKRLWAVQFQKALGLLGIRSNIAINNYSIRLAVRKADTHRFGDVVGFINSVKQAKLKKVVVSNKHQSKGVGRVVNVDSIEVTNDWVPMYDVVNSESHMFAIEGIVTHNTEADMMKRAMYLADEMITPKYPTAMFVNMVHDEIVFEADESEAEEVGALVTKAMEMAGREYITAVPVVAEYQIADSWAEK